MQKLRSLNLSSDNLLTVDEFIQDLRQRKYDDLFYEYPEENINRIETALNLPNLLEKRISMIKEAKNRERDQSSIWCMDRTITELENLLKESKKL